MGLVERGGGHWRAVREERLEVVARTGTGLGTRLDGGQGTPPRGPPPPPASRIGLGPSGEARYAAPPTSRCLLAPRPRHPTSAEEAAEIVERPVSAGRLGGVRRGIPVGWPRGWNSLPGRGALPGLRAGRLPNWVAGGSVVWDSVRERFLVPFGEVAVRIQY